MENSNSARNVPVPAAAPVASCSGRNRLDLFFISFLILFFELACIRWFPAHVLFLTFFTNTVLLASFLGMSLGCLAAGNRTDHLLRTPAWLALAMILGQLLARLRVPLETVIRVGTQAAPQVVFFGNDYREANPAHFFVPIEVVEGIFFVLIALAFIGPGQTLGRALERVPNRMEAYILNISGSLAGVLIFALGARFELSPLWWFLAVAAGLGYFLSYGDTARPPEARRAGLVRLAVVVGLSALTCGTVRENGRPVGEYLWSPYYRIDYLYPPVRHIAVNLIGHQSMTSRKDRGYAYQFPYLLQRDAGGVPFQNVLIIGAGSGNDVSRALQWGTRHIDAVEIDPTILRLGARDHPDQPYADPRVTTYVDDGRNFLRASHGQYDLIIYALVDSLVLHSSYSDIRLESYLFTREAFSDVRRHLKPNGLFVMYNYFRQGWIVARLAKEVQETFGQPPLVFTLPYRASVGPDEDGGFTLVAAGASAPWAAAFAAHPEYWLPGGEAPGPQTPDGFSQQPSASQREDWIRLGPAKVAEIPGLPSATDDWPFLYVRHRTIPALGLRGIATMGGISFLLIYLGMRRARRCHEPWRLDGRMFFLGAGFMLLEAEAVVHMALLFGSTWMVNTIVFAAVLVMILAANLYTLKVRPVRLAPYYAGLVLSLAANVLLPLSFFLAMGRFRQATASCLLVFTPIFFAGVIFATCFSRSVAPDQDFGANVGGAILGGLSEYASTLLGFQYLTLLAVVFYLLSAYFGRRVAVASVPPPAV